MPTHLLLEYGKIGNESKDAAVPHGAFGHRRYHEHIHPFGVTTAITTLKTLVCAIGAGLAAWGVINLLEGYGTDNPGAKSQGIKHLMSSM